MTIITEAAEVAEVESALKSSLSLIKWRLKPHSWRRLHIGMRPVVMVDYGGKMPELPARLCGFLAHAQNELPMFRQLRIMVIEDMIYIVNIDEFAEYIRWTLASGGAKQVFVDLEKDPLKMTTGAAENSGAMQLLLVQKLFSSIFSGSGVNYNNDNDNALQHLRNDSIDNAKASSSLPVTSKFSEVIDLSSCLHDSQVTVPTLNGWLLYYPVVYLFRKDHIPDAVYIFQQNPSASSKSWYAVSRCLMT